MVRTILAVVAAALALPSALLAEPIGDSIRFDVDAAGQIRVQAFVNGQGPFVFALDTGSNVSSVGAGVAERLALPVVAKTDLKTSAGRKTQIVVRLDRLAVGSAARNALLATVIEKAQLEAVGSGLDGVIGQDLLLGFNYTLDYRNRRLDWGRTEQDGGARLALVRRNGRVLVELPQADRVLRFVPDSGAESFVIFERRGQAPLPLAETGRSARLVSVAGLRDVRVMVLRWLRVGDAMVENQPALVVARDEPDAPEGDGLLPLHLFTSVSFNNTEGYVVVRR